MTGGSCIDVPTSVKSPVTSIGTRRGGGVERDRSATEAHPDDHATLEAVHVACMQDGISVTSYNTHIERERTASATARELLSDNEPEKVELA